LPICSTEEKILDKAVDRFREETGKNRDSTLNPNPISSTLE
jgi:hypothetical protein